MASPGDANRGPPTASHKPLPIHRPMCDLYIGHNKRTVRPLPLESQHCIRGHVNCGNHRTEFSLFHRMRTNIVQSLEREAALEVETSAECYPTNQNSGDINQSQLRNALAGAGPARPELLCLRSPRLPISDSRLPWGILQRGGQQSTTD